MTILGLQLDCRWEDRAANYERVTALLAAAPPPPGSLLVLPEMFATGFSLDPTVTAETPDGPTARFAAALARQYRSHLIAGLVERGADGLARNLALVFDPAGEVLGRYAKRHPFAPGGEDRVHAAGRDLLILDLDGWRVCPLICYDLRFPEDFRSATARGAQLFAVLASWPLVAGRSQHWRSLLTARAIENQAAVIGVNRCGCDPRHRYAGGSLVLGPRGEALAEAPAKAGEVLLRAELDLADLTAYRRDFPVLRDCRAD